MIELINFAFSMKKIKPVKKKYSAKTIAFFLNLFPPLFFNRIILKKVNNTFSDLDILIKYSWMNRNIQKSIFGGTIFSAFDPFFAIMYWQAFSKLNLPMEVWVKSADINYLKPAKSDLFINFKIEDTDIQNAIDHLKDNYKYEVCHTIKAYDKTGEAYAEARILIYIRNSNGFDISHL